MHELSIALSLIEMAEEQAEQLGGVRVEALRLKLGPLSGVVREALLFSFDLAAAGTAIEGARLEIEDVPVIVFCQNCNASATLAEHPELSLPGLRHPHAGRRPGAGARADRVGSVRVGGDECSPGSLRCARESSRRTTFSPKACASGSRAAGVYVVNLVSSPGAGKTALLEETLRRLHPRHRVAARWETWRPTATRNAWAAPAPVCGRSPPAPSATSTPTC